ncbi:Rv2732c family membrane protein [Gordonia aquimaris]|uniref:Transmembrane protein n=1 Tax=Gordonia aquimaris TaxID=2984863 RepID=A0A9X3D7N2_9ACTN|nr:hypothetical protein [Gordonia aquimaris]MCX2966370.1 hypothetical protein [Gordonia aquimaris]
MKDVFADYHRELAGIERRVAREVRPGGPRRRGLWTAVVVAAASSALPLTFRGAGFAGGPDASLLMRADIILVLAVAGLSAAALCTRRWGLAACAFGVGGFTSAFGLFALWSQNTLPEPTPTVSPLYLAGWIATIVGTVLWAAVVTSRPATDRDTTDRNGPASAN